jgi:hypothetical protein
VEGVVFQVPKGMLQTSLLTPQSGGTKAVSSPQGNATNFIGEIKAFFEENLFQVPKGMLQTLLNQ